MNPFRALDRLGWLAVAIGALVLAGLGWWILTEPGRQKSVAATATGTAIVATGGQAAAHDALNASETAAEAARASQAITDQNHAEILSTPGAGASVGPVSDAGLRSLCRRAVYADNPRCRSVRAAGS